MAATAAGRRLTEQHRAEQVQVQDRFLIEFLALWGLLDLRRPADTADAWVRAVLQLIRQFRVRGVELADEYHTAFRLAEAPEAPSFEPPPRPQSRGSVALLSDRRLNRILDRRDVEPTGPARDLESMEAAAEQSVRLTGPINAAFRQRQLQPQQRIERATLTQASGAATRHVAAGARQRALQLVQSDRRAVGWIRVTREDPCYFCAMLASRGPVYKNEFAGGRVSNRREKNTRGDARDQFVGDGEFKVHDHCRCYLEPVYVDLPREQWPGRGAEFQDLWYQTTERYSGWDKAKAFRRAYEQLQRDARRQAAAA